MNELNHCFTAHVKHCLNHARARDNPPMPHTKKGGGIPSGAPLLAQKITQAMDNHDPKITLTEMAKACGVTVQAVHGWRTNGRISKPKLRILAGVTGRGLDYFMSDRPLQRNGELTHQDAFETVKSAWDTAPQDQKEILLGVAKGILNAQRGKRSGKA